MRSMPQHRTLNHHFFKTWTPEMAYVLGYIAADGTITMGKRGNQYVEVQSIDKELPYAVKQALGARHAVTFRRRNQRWKTVYRLQIGSKELVRDLVSLGITPQKTHRLPFPFVPNEFLSDFVRGYFDGDGNVLFQRFKRTDRKRGFGKYMRVLFTSSSHGFLNGLFQSLAINPGLESGALVREESYSRLRYYRKGDVRKLFEFLYGNRPTFYLSREFKYFRNALIAMGR